VRGAVTIRRLSNEAFDWLEKMVADRGAEYANPLETITCVLPRDTAS
jgi:hypothetical protein